MRYTAQAVQRALDVEEALATRQALHEQRELDALHGRCHYCHGTRRVWDGSGTCANTQSSRRCPICNGAG